MFDLQRGEHFGNPGAAAEYLEVSVTDLKKQSPRPITERVTGPSFRFRLERVRALRKHKEDFAKQELALAMTRLSGSEDRLRTVDARLQRAHADQRTVIGEPSIRSAGELTARQAFVERVETQRRADIHDVECREAEVADRGAELGHAAREHKMLERLKERHRAEHDREMGRRESNTLDEIALDCFRRSAA